MKQIVLASRNEKKAKELQEILEGLPFEILSLESFPNCPEVEEDGTTFEENSAKKAMEVSGYTGLWTLADDSGLVVDALGGEPGTYSARYGGKDTDEERNLHLLENLKGVPSEKRTARFVCCATLFGDGQVLFQATETVEGRILDEERGEGGFGYDPLFLPEGFCITTAEMTPDQKHRISHRGKAFRKVKEFLTGLQIDE